ncbi:hypothetical protein BDY17DRAFT_289198 [Neohortaea acidophila]|uniref:PHD-type domain-containing protein n=1 Tax=Neohortaea acidophila TaxID=245834 RepID=A0A6A6Q661_9PEZI|nr:uncharacterized protein BDY17DRAFT_289198 [Neohortaea acidophila]KAF2487561.1 hypothetical protein BDY17DRAFT_289198 [Neohortaea acidophila]
MHAATADDAPATSGEAANTPEHVPTTSAPPDPDSTSVISSAPATDDLEPVEAQATSLKADGNDAASIRPVTPDATTSAQTQLAAGGSNDTADNPESEEPAQKASQGEVMQGVEATDQAPTSTPAKTEPLSEKTPAQADAAQPLKPEDTIQVTPASTGRGRGGGRPRGRGRGGGRGSKRKRERDDDELTEDSEVYTPVVTTTKSGRSVQKPAAFVPPPASPTASNKRKRSYRKNPESAVCKVCLRGTSPITNMIVFCDGCNTPYHQYCHFPPIEQAVVNELDKEWYCKQCEKERVLPVPESQVANFISGEGASLEQRQRYFASLSPGMLVTLLIRATTLKPDLPLFPPDFQARTGSIGQIAQHQGPSIGANGHTHPGAASHPAQISHSMPTPTAYPQQSHYAMPQHYQPATAGATHMQPQQQHYMQHYPQHHYGPEVHPPNYPRPGHGLMRTLPAAHEDMQWLVDDGDRYGVFSHMYQVNPQGNGPMRGPAQ